MKNYVCGFLFKTVQEDIDTGFMGVTFPGKRTYVALIRKNKPDFQKGKLNGIGGGIEKVGEGRLHESADFPTGSLPIFETPEAAMHREFLEETGADIPESEWVRFCVFKDIRGYLVYFCKAFSDKDVPLKSMTEEIVSWYPLDELFLGRLKTMSNLQWLIPLALDKFQPVAEIEETFDATRQDTGSN